jgi:exodeoxyribonuclease VII large subunit
MQKAITVTTLNNQIKSLLESHYVNITVKGEVSRVTYHSSGHVYFNLKDEKSSISCVMFRGNSRSLKFTIEDGMSVIVLGGISVYTPRGSYQVNVISLELEGSGALSIAYEQLKEKLSKKGYFDKSIKKSLPSFPKKIALVTSKSGAALQDMLRVAKNRYPLIKFILIDTLVQGESSAKDIEKNIIVADKLGVDIIIVARGGGSLEDLWSFNEEIVATAIYNAKTPVISAVGHEIDYMISDFCADVRASTPSNAIEIAVADKNELFITIDSYLDRYNNILKNILNKKSQEFLHIEEIFEHNSIKSRLSSVDLEIKFIDSSFKSFISLVFDRKDRELNALFELYNHSNPTIKYRSGVAQVVKDGKAINLEVLKEGDEFELLNSKVRVDSIVKRVSIKS